MNNKNISVKIWVQNSALSVFSLIFILAFGEWLFPKFLNKVPFRLYGGVESELRVLAQYSKQSVLPRDYIAILGDSNSVGLGDLYNELRRNFWNWYPDYSPAHFIHKNVGIDVISFGFAGAGSIDGIWSGPINQFNFINSQGFNLKPPKTILVLFYEGNDIANSLQFVRENYTGNEGIEELVQSNKFNEWLNHNFNKSIKIKDISFTYPNNKPVINNLSLQIKKGQMIAIVGESGSGKSTLIDVIMGFNDPTSGDILIDETPLKKYDINSYREKIGYVPQGGELFNASVIKNIKWANEKATDEQVQHICKETYADSFIKSLPEGYETLVGDRGIRLSGGQLQRIALARALIRKPEILILDEATSSLDSKSEKNIQEAINKIVKKTTIIVIAHRLSTILKADHIYVINHGRVVEEGNYKDLIALNGSFKRMIEQQAFISTG